MESRDTSLLTLAIVFAFSLTSCTTGGTADAALDPKSWDMAVAYRNKVNFFRNDTLIRNVAVNSNEITALAYDSANRILYTSYNERSRFSSLLYRSDLAEENLIPQPVFDRRVNIQSISSMDFDPVTKTLFWIDRQLHLLRKMEVSSNEPEILHNLEGRSSDVIALDICNRFIYWTNNDSTVDNIERSRLDGTDRRVILSDGLFKVVALAVDHYGGKLYFTYRYDLEYGTERDASLHAIVESNLDGTDRRILLQFSRDLFPYRLAVDKTAVYFSDCKDYSIHKVYRNGTRKRITRFYSKGRSDPCPMNIRTRYNVGDVCSGSGCSKSTSGLFRVSCIVMLISFVYTSM